MHVEHVQSLVACASAGNTSHQQVKVDKHYPGWEHQRLVATDQGVFGGGGGEATPRGVRGEESSFIILFISIEHDKDRKIKFNV